MSYHLFLDDERNPYKVTWIRLPDAVWEVVRSYDQFVEAINILGVPGFVSFDHDLADEHYVKMLTDHDADSEIDYGSEKTGYDCAKFLVDFCADNGHKFPEYAVHSMNPIGSERIRAYIENAKIHMGI